LFIAFPYLAVALLFVGIAARYMIERPRIEEAREEARAAWRRYRGGMIWRPALAVVVLAHLAALALPRTILSWNASPMRLYLLEGTGWLLGVIALIGWAQVMWRHLRQQVGSKFSEAADCIFLSLFFVGILSGLWTSI